MSGFFTRIILINERLYTPAELGLTLLEMTNGHVEQVVINGGERMTFGHAFTRLAQLSVPAYCVIANSDIFFDETLLLVRRGTLAEARGVYALQRWEYSHQQSVMGPTGGEDVWIFHTNFLPPLLALTQSILLGIPACDHVILGWFHVNNFTIYNEPHVIKTYHYHQSNVRTYTRKDIITGLRALVPPAPINKF